MNTAKNLFQFFEWELQKKVRKGENAGFVKIEIAWQRIEQSDNCLMFQTLNATINITLSITASNARIHTFLEIISPVLGTTLNQPHWSLSTIKIIKTVSLILFSVVSQMWVTSIFCFSPVMFYNIQSMGECNTILSAYTKYRHLG